MQRAIKLSLLTIGFLFFISCEKVAFEPVKVEGTVSFTTEVMPVINTNCSSCHRDFKAQDNFYKNLATKNYIDTVDATSSKIYIKLSTNTDHQNKITPENLAKILKWFEQGAKNN